MLQSMTGFGAARATVEGEEISVELRSVNHKFVEVKVRLPRELAALETTVVKTVKDRLVRGAVEVSIRRGAGADSERTPQIDLALAREYARAFSALAADLGLASKPELGHLLSQPGVVKLEERTANVEHATAALQQALSGALDALGEMRRREGEALAADLEGRLSTLEGWVAEVSKLAPQTVSEHHQRLQERLGELLGTGAGGSVDPQRLAQEVAIFADRIDVSEEMTRLASHLDQFRGLITSREPAGRKMDFLVQEMHREVNTTGSKSQNAQISSRIVSMKAELERIREQVANVE